VNYDAPETMQSVIKLLPGIDQFGNHLEKQES
jgi:hypothetical protein